MLPRTSGLFFLLHKKLHFDHIKIIRNKQISVIILSAFCSVKFFTILNVLILCVIQYKILYAKLLGKLAGILNCGMMFLIRIEDVTLSIQAKCFMQKPFTSLCIFFFPVTVRFISTAGQFLSFF